MCQLRDYDATMAPSVPLVVVREVAHANLEFLVAAEIHAYNKELVNLKQEVSWASICMKPFAVFLHELDDLRLRETKTVEVVAHAIEDLGECPTPDHLVDEDLCLLGRFRLHIATVFLEVGIDPTRKGILRFRDGRLPVRFIEFESFRDRDVIDDTY